MNITVQIKSVYGNDMVYPVCDKAKLFTALTGNKTLSHRDLANIKALGFAIQIGHAASTFDRLSTV